MPDTPSSGVEAREQNAFRSVYRHALPVRITHWVNLLVLIVMLGSGLQILIAHPALYWGSRSDPEQAWLSMEARRLEGGELQGVTRLFGWEFVTTGFLGVTEGQFGQSEVRAVPRWATIPSNRWLAMGRRWHLFFAWLFVLNGLIYLGYTVAGRHLRRDLWPGREELKGFGRSIRQHLSVRQIRAESARGYNVLQKLSYLVVIFLLGPLALLTGLTMSPWLDSIWPGLLTIFDGRQTARSIHFLVAFGLVAFTVIHVAMVLVVGPINHMRAMITGWLRIKETKE